MIAAMSGLIFRKDGTAQGVAKQRLIETIAKPDERIITDPYADRFVLGASVIKLIGHKLNVWLAQNLYPAYTNISFRGHASLMILLKEVLRVNLSNMLFWGLDMTAELTGLNFHLR